MVHIYRKNFFNNPNVGLYGFVNNKIGLFGKSLSKKYIKEIEERLKIKIYQISIANTSLIGLFLNGNNSKIIVPNIITDEELKELKKIPFDFEIFDTKYTALGNNFLINDNAILSTPLINEKEKEDLSKIFGLKVKKSTIYDIEIVGSLCVLSNNTGLITDYATEEEKKLIENHFSIKLFEGTLNMGSIYVKSGLIINENGFVTSLDTTGIEILNIDEGFGFLNKG